MEIRSLQYLTAVCDAPSLSAAAERLYLTPQALSKSIHRLEEELGVSLFYREKGRLLLTPFGHEALRETRAFLQEYENFRTRLLRLSGQEQGHVGVVFAHGVPNALPAGLLEGYEARCPQVQLDVLELPDLLAERAVLEEESDLGLLIGPFPADSPLQWHPLFNFRLCAAVHPSHPLASLGTLSVEDLAGQPLITKNTLFQVYHLLEAQAAARGIPLSYALRSPDEIRWLHMVEHGRGVGIGVSFLTGADKGAGTGLVYLPFQEPELKWEVCAAVLQGHYLSPAARGLLDYLHMELAPHQG